MESHGEYARISRAASQVRYPDQAAAKLRIRYGKLTCEKQFRRLPGKNMRSCHATVAGQFAEHPVGRLFSHPTARYLVDGCLPFPVDLAIVHSPLKSGMHAGGAQLSGRGVGTALRFVGHQLFTKPNPAPRIHLPPCAAPGTA